MRITFSLNRVRGYSPLEPRLWGGSEEAVAELAAALHERGHRCIILHQDGIDASSFRGVPIVPRSLYPDSTEDVLVVVKHVDYAGLPLAKKTVFWSCDPDREFGARELHRVVAISEWHRRELRALNTGSAFMQSDRVVALPLGLPARILEAKWKIDTGDLTPEWCHHRCLYASSFDRGLESLLDCWPRVREAVPDARLDVCYGWDIFDWIWEGRMPPRLFRWKLSMQEKLRQPGVNYLGRLERSDDPAPFLAAGIWAYPCTGGERFCLTGQKAQALGAVPVVVPTMALAETVRFGVQVPTQREGVDGTDRTIEAFVGALVDCMLDERVQRAERRRMLREFCAPSWGEVAERWEREVLA